MVVVPIIMDLYLHIIQYRSLRGLYRGYAVILENGNFQGFLGVSFFFHMGACARGFFVQGGTVGNTRFERDPKQEGTYLTAFSGKSI